MKRSAPAQPLYRVLHSVEDAYSVSRTIAAELQRLSGRARLARVAELEELCQGIELHVQSLEAQMSAVRKELQLNQKNARVCIAYTRAQKRS